MADSTRPCVLLHAELKGSDRFLRDLSGRELLVAQKKNRWLIVGASSDFSRLSCGVGYRDRYTDLLKRDKMEFEF